MGWVAHGFSRGGHDSANQFESPTSEEMGHPSNHVRCRSSPTPLSVGRRIVNRLSLFIMDACMDATMTDLLADLNAQQREAVTHGDGPLLILAGPGSGKTRVVTRRAAYLACTIAKPWQILAITFTNKAAREMRERIEALDVGQGMTVCTFHALCAKLLRVYHERADVSRDFSIVDRDDRRKLVKLAIKEFSRIFNTTIPHEGMSAFLEKRAPEFEGR